MPRHLHVWIALAFMSWVFTISMPAHIPHFAGSVALVLGLRRIRGRA